MYGVLVVKINHIKIMAKKQLKKIPGFSRYSIDRKGVVTKDLSGEVIATYRETKVKLMSDEGKRTWVDAQEIAAKLFVKEPKPADPFKAEILKTKSSSVEPESNVPVNGRKYHFDKMSADQKKGIHASNKLTTDQVIEIRRKYDSGESTKKQIAADYGICWQTAGKICNRRIYKSIPEVNPQPVE